MKEQKDILQKFSRLFNQPTLLEISNMTGIQITRVFRIMNFSPMRFNEYLIFQKLIDSKTPKKSEGEIPLDKTLSELSLDTVQEIKQLIDRKLFLKKLIQVEDDSEVMYA